MWKVIFAKNIFNAGSLFLRVAILSSWSYKREIIVSIRFVMNKTLVIKIGTVYCIRRQET